MKGIFFQGKISKGLSVVCLGVGLILGAFQTQRVQASNRHNRDTIFAQCTGFSAGCFSNFSCTVQTGEHCLDQTEADFKEGVQVAFMYCISAESGTCDVADEVCFQERHYHASLFSNCATLCGAVSRRTPGCH